MPRANQNKKGAPKKPSKPKVPPRPVPPSTQSQAQAEDDDHYKYKAYIAFVDDPKLKTPFTVLQSSNIRCLERKRYVNNTYLNDNRRKRRFDVAFTNIFTVPCRIFAKAVNDVRLVVLHNKCQELNQQFKVLMACKVDVETAYQRLLEANPRKVTDGLQYETGESNDDNEQAKRQLLSDTPSSYTDDGGSASLRDRIEDIDKSNEDLPGSDTATKDKHSEKSDIGQHSEEHSDSEKEENDNKSRKENESNDHSASEISNSDEVCTLK